MKYALKVNNHVICNDKLYCYDKDPYNPLNLPPNTIRCKFAQGYTPTEGDTQTLVDANENIWDIYEDSNNWYGMFDKPGWNNYDLLEVLGANTSNITNTDHMFVGCRALTHVALFDTSNVTDMREMFWVCNSLTSVPLFDTSNVTRMEQMLGGCYSITSIPLFNTSNVTNMDYMCIACYNVETGALALYNQVSSQTNPPSNHSQTFKDCGINTVTGAEELAQIPSDWK